MRNARGLRVGLVVLVLLAGCTHGKSREEKAGANANASASSSAASSAAPATGNAGAREWLNGDLPASVNEGEPRAGGDLTIGVGSDPPSLNTNLDNDLIATWITTQRVYEGLLELDPFDDPDYKIAPGLAETWEVSPDRLTYTFHLRKGVKWHDGQPFTSRDVMATFDKIQDTTTRCAVMRSLLAELASYSAPDDFTFVAKWKRPYFLAPDTFAGVMIQPAHLIQKLKGSDYNEATKNPLNRAPVGTGPFKFVAWKDRKIVLARNETYRGQKPYLDRLIFRIETDHTVMLQLAARNQLDVVEQVTSDQWMHMDDPALHDNWNRSRSFGNNYAWIGWNEERPFFADKRVRKALTLLIDRPGIIGKMLYGLPRPTTCHFYWASHACDPNLAPLPFDPAAAQKLLDEAGWRDSNGDGVRDKNGVPFHFVLSLPVGSSEAGRWAAKIKEDMGRAGIEMEIRPVEWAAYSKMLEEHRFDACTLLWGSTSPRDEPSQIWHSTSNKNGSNYINYKNAEVDKLLESARVIFDDAERDAVYRKLGAILYEDQPYTWMYVRPNLDLLHKRVKGAKLSLAWWQFERMWIDPKWGAAGATK